MSSTVIHHRTTPTGTDARSPETTETDDETELKDESGGKITTTIDSSAVAVEVQGESAESAKMVGMTQSDENAVAVRIVTVMTCATGVEIGTGGMTGIEDVKVSLIIIKACILIPHCDYHRK